MGKSFDVWAVCKDPGGTKGILSVVKEIRSEGIGVLLITNGKATELLANQGIQFISYGSAEAVIAENQPPKVLITSMCSKGGVGRDLVPLLKSMCIKTFALQDFWGGTLWGEWADSKYRPDFVCVNDRVGQEIVCKAWPEFPITRVEITGYPALDSYANYDCEAAKREICEILGLSEDKPIILFGGQGEYTGHALGEIVEVLNYLHGDVYFLPRPHPRTKDDFKSEMKLWQEALSKLRGGTLVVDFFNQVNPQSLVGAATAVISMYSTILVEAAVLRKQNISVLYPHEGMAQFLSAVRGLREFPLVELGCSVKVENRHELTKAMYKAMIVSLTQGLKNNQEKHFKLDGKNAHRVMELVSRFL